MFILIRNHFVCNFLWVVLFSYELPNANAEYNCINPNRKPGICSSIYDCPTLLSVYQYPTTTTQMVFIQKSLCAAGTGHFPFVCCTPDYDFNTNFEIWPSNGMANILPLPPNCGPISRTKRVYNGNDTALDQYPWMVVLEYIQTNGDLLLICGGSLINQRYVLTAAHCVEQIHEYFAFKVRLGEYDTSKEIDCIGNYCNQRVLEVDVEQIIKHPLFNQQMGLTYDIALLRLNVDVIYNDFIRPVCLPLEAAVTLFPSGQIFTSVGWGKTQLGHPSHIKQHVQLPVVDIFECQRRYKMINIHLTGAEICAGGEGNQSNCYGDSGGPLMRIRENGHWYMEGIVAGGIQCGLKDWPAVYIRVSIYIHWILQNLRP